MKHSSFNLVRQMERFLNLSESSHVSTRKRAYRKRLGKGRQNLAGDEQTICPSHSSGLIRCAPFSFADCGDRKFSQARKNE